MMSGKCLFRLCGSGIYSRTSCCNTKCLRPVRTLFNESENHGNSNTETLFPINNRGNTSKTHSILQMKCTNLAVSNQRSLSTTSVTTALNVRPVKITSRLAAEQLIRNITEEERNRLSVALQDLEQELLLEQGLQKQKPTFKQLWLLAFTNSIPFVGFGFLDNAIMILAGEYIDYTVGTALGISTMAAAAIGNMISDIAGIGLAGYVEIWASRLGFEEPRLTPLQLTMTQSRIACNLGRAIGIVIGCIIGMFPLLYITPVNHQEESEHEVDESTQK